MTASTQPLKHGWPLTFPWWMPHQLTPVASWTTWRTGWEREAEHYQGKEVNPQSQSSIQSLTESINCHLPKNWLNLQVTYCWLHVLIGTVFGDNNLIGNCIPLAVWLVVDTKFISNWDRSFFVRVCEGSSSPLLMGKNKQKQLLVCRSYAWRRGSGLNRPRHHTAAWITFICLDTIRWDLQHHQWPRS
jgi:hypothetical protein